MPHTMRRRRVPGFYPKSSFSGTLSMFTIDQLEHVYAGDPVMRIDQWHAAQGEQWLLTGSSGSGKTTLLHVLAGILRPSSGRVTVAGEDLLALSGPALDRFRGREIGIVLQRLHLIASLSVGQNLALAQSLAGLPVDKARIEAVLESLDLAGKTDARPHQLSFGQAQRAAVARAVVNRPKLLLADEPTSNLDDARCEQVLGLLQAQAHACGATLLIATHDGRLKPHLSLQRALAVQP
jgi:putative ABC transport system ATP-binding protein